MNSATCVVISLEEVATGNGIWVLCPGGEPYRLDISS